MTNLTLQLSIIYSVLFIIAAVPVSILLMENKKRSLLSLAATAGLAAAAYFFIGTVVEFGFQNIALFNTLIRWLHGKLPHVVNHLDSISILLTLVITSIFSWVLYFSLKDKNSKPNRIRGAEVKSYGSFKRESKINNTSKRALKICGIPMNNWQKELSVLIVGGLGSRKTQLILSLVVGAKSLGHKLIVHDVGGDILSRTKNAKDVILSLTDGRSVLYSLFSEVRCKADFVMIANAFIAIVTGENRYFYEQARLLLACLLEELWRQKKRTNRAIVHYALFATIDELAELLSKTKANRLFMPGNEKVLSNVLSILNANLSCLEMLSPDAGSKSFSLRRWLEDDESKTLYIPYDDVTASSTEPMRRFWIQLLINSALTLDPNKKRDIGFVMDELASAGQLEAFDKGMSRGRKHGLRFWVGVQNTPQLYAIYGKHPADNILSCFGNRVFLRTADAETGEYLSRTIGDSEVENEQISLNSSTNSKTIQFGEKIRRAVLASELANLPDGHGYLNMAGSVWVKITVPNIYSKLPVKVKSFMSKNEVAKLRSAKAKASKKTAKLSVHKPISSEHKAPKNTIKQALKQRKPAQKLVAKSANNKPLDEV